MSMWKSHQENTYVTDGGGKRLNWATQNCLGKLGDVTDYFFSVLLFIYLLV